MEVRSFLYSVFEGDPESVSLSMLPFDEEGLQHLAVCINHNANLKRLDLWSCNCSNLVHLFPLISQSRIESLNLGANNLDDESMFVLSEYVQKDGALPALRELDLSNNSITKVGCRYLMVLLRLRNLTSLDLRANKIDSRGLIHLIEAIPSSLLSLCMFNNPIQNDGAHALVRVLKNNKTLQYIDLRATLITDIAVLCELNSMLLRNRTDVSVGFERAPAVSTKFQKAILPVVSPKVHERASFFEVPNVAPATPVVKKTVVQTMDSPLGSITDSRENLAPMDANDSTQELIDNQLDEIASLRSEVKSTRSTLLKTSDLLESTTTENVALRAETAELKQDNKNQEKSLEELRSNVDLLTKQLNSAVEESASLHAKSKDSTAHVESMDALVAEYKVMIGELKEERKTLKTDMSTLTNDNRRLRKAAVELADRERDLTQLQAKYAEAAVDHVDVKDKLDKVYKELNSTTLELRERTQELSIFKKDYHDLLREDEEMETNYKLLEKRCDAESEKVRSLEQDVQLKDQQIANLTEKKDDLLNAIDLVKKERIRVNAAMETMQNDLSKALEEKKSAVDEVKQLNERNDEDWRQFYVEKDDYRREIDKANARRMDVEDEVLRLNGIITELKEEDVIQQRKIDQLTLGEGKALAACEELRHECASWSERFKKKELEYTTQISEKDGLVEELCTELDSTRTKLDISEETLARYKTDYQRVQEEYETYQSENPTEMLVDLETLKTENAELLTQLNNAAVVYQSDSVDLAKQNAELADQITELQNTVEERQSRLDDRQKLFSQALDEVDGLKRSNEALKTELEQVKSQLGEVTAERDAALETTTVLQNRVVSVDAIEEELEQREDILEFYIREVDGLKLENKEYVKKIEQLNAKIEHFVAHTAELETAMVYEVQEKEVMTNMLSELCTPPANKPSSVITDMSEKSPASERLLKSRQSVNDELSRISASPLRKTQLFIEREDEFEEVSNPEQLFRQFLSPEELEQINV
ncbi:hypothetical protein PCE1_001011 [Barthelona sp. PCE]